jgi:hypothetical protein
LRAREEALVLIADVHEGGGRLMRPAVKSIPHLASDGTNQVLKRHVVTPAPLNGDLNAMTQNCGVFDTVIFSVEDLFAHFHGNALFGHATISGANPIAMNTMR